MDLRHSGTLFLIFLVIAFTACQQKETPQELREKTAEATAQAKSDAKAVADGIREGWNRNQQVDLNSASREQLVSLPGMNSAEAEQVIAGRPYKDPGELMTRHIMSKAEYDRISDRVTAKR